MAEYFKEPQNPLKKIDETTGDVTYVYPLTTDKQVIMENGERLNTILNENILYLGEAEDDVSVAPVDADTLGGIPAEEYVKKSETGMDLLWTNASPTSEFAAQTISLDLSNYSFFLIEAYENTALSGCTTVIVPKGKATRILLMWNTRQTRIISINDKKIEFSEGNKGAYNAALTTDNTSAIPAKIYGIK